MRQQEHGRPAIPDAQHWPHFTGEDVEIHGCKVTPGLRSKRAWVPDSQATVLILRPCKNPKSTGQADISPHLATLGPGVRALALVALPHSSILLL